MQATNPEQDVELDLAGNSSSQIRSRYEEGKATQLGSGVRTETEVLKLSA